MLFLLYWLCYAVAFGTAICFAAYKAALVQRTLAVALRRGLRGLLHDTASQSEECTITRTNTGEGQSQLEQSQPRQILLLAGDLVHPSARYELQA